VAVRPTCWWVSGFLARHRDLRHRYCAGIEHADAFESALVAAFNGRNNPDHFFWGEIADQLGKGEQFKPFWIGGPKAPDEKDWLNPSLTSRWSFRLIFSVFRRFQLALRQ
jgi:hypothetical protein